MAWSTGAKVAVVVVPIVLIGGGVGFWMWRRHKRKGVDLPAQAAQVALAAPAIVAKPDLRIVAKQAHAKRSFWGKARGLAKQGVKYGAIAGVPGAGQVAATGIV